MGRLTTIEDIEKREAAQDDEQMRAAQEAMLNSRAKTGSHASVADRVQETRAPRADKSQMSRQGEGGPAKDAPSKSQAQQEVDFHGLDNLEKKSGGHIALIVVAVAIAVVAALKIANVF